MKQTKNWNILYVLTLANKTYIRSDVGLNMFHNYKTNTEKFGKLTGFDNYIIYKYINSMKNHKNIDSFFSSFSHEYAISYPYRLVDYNQTLLTCLFISIERITNINDCTPSYKEKLSN